MRVIEAEGVRLAHIAPEDGELRALCGTRPFPSKWERPVVASKPLCRSCLARRRHG